MAKAVTISEMAKKLGVSTATVTKALHGQGRISAVTVERVKNLAREMNYIPNIAARALRTNVKNAVGLLIVSDITNPWYSQMTSLLEKELSDRGLTMLLALGKNDPGKMPDILENFIGNGVRGILAGPIATKKDLELFQAAIDRNIPLIIFGNIEPLPLNFVAIEQSTGAKIAVEHLYKQGHRRIMYFGAPEKSSRRQKGTRSAGYTEFMEQHGLIPEYYSFDTLEFNRKVAFLAAKKLLKEFPGEKMPTALFCHNDDIALGVIPALQQAGLNVPNDISVIGFDDIAESDFFLPELTTIGGLMDSISKELLNALDQLVRSEQTGLYQKFIIPELILRSTTSKPRRIQQQ